MEHENDLFQEMPAVNPEPAAAPAPKRRGRPPKKKTADNAAPAETVKTDV